MELFSNPLLNFALLWIGISVFVSTIGGWFSLARRYRATQAVQGERFRFVSGTMGASLFPVSYANCLTVAVNEAGFGLSVFVLFRLFSPPLFIPWSAVKSVEAKRFLFRRNAFIRLHDQWPAIALSGRAGERVLSAYAARQ